MLECNGLSNQVPDRAGSRTVVVVVLLVVLSGAVASTNIASLLSTSNTTGPSVTNTSPPTSVTDDGNTTILVVDDAPIAIQGDTEMNARAAQRGWPGDGSEASPFVIQQLGILSSSDCIYIKYVGAHFVIRECFLYSTDARALCIEGSMNGLVDNCGLYGAVSGLELVLCNWTTVCDCRVSSPNVGVNACACGDVSILSNTISGCWSGISAGIENSNIRQNILVSNSIGIDMWLGRYSTIDSNEISCSDIGITVYYGFQCIISSNGILNSTAYGLNFDSSVDNVQVILNRFAWNAVANANDDGTYNTWDDGVSLGNYWSDYSGAGYYTISGSAGSLDHYPSVFVP